MKKTNTHGSMVEFQSPELLWLAESGQPYRATLFIQFINNGSVMDLIELKKYITSLRDKTIILEDIAATIHSAVLEMSGLEDVAVTVKSTARGGISSTVFYGCPLFGQPESKPLYFGLPA